MLWERIPLSPPKLPELITIITSYLPLKKKLEARLVNRTWCENTRLPADRAELIFHKGIQTNDKIVVERMLRQVDPSDAQNSAILWASRCEKQAVSTKTVQYGSEGEYSITNVDILGTTDGNEVNGLRARLGKGQGATTTALQTVSAPVQTVCKTVDHKTRWTVRRLFRSLYVSFFLPPFFPSFTRTFSPKNG